ncbi:hypothetical protein C8J57DRAFT_1706766 [Mycena rebaudengoi]|nr:hypothetical protein C8J57DRAFT_1706766 [Mycena rebaudengoi]
MAPRHPHRLRVHSRQRAAPLQRHTIRGVTTETAKTAMNCDQNSYKLRMPFGHIWALLCSMYEGMGGPPARPYRHRRVSQRERATLRRPLLIWKRYLPLSPDDAGEYWGLKPMPQLAPLRHPLRGMYEGTGGQPARPYRHRRVSRCKLATWRACHSSEEIPSELWDDAGEYWGLKPPPNPAPLQHPLWEYERRPLFASSSFRTDNQTI